MGDSSELLLCLDSNFKLKPAKKENNFKNKSHSPIFPQKLSFSSNHKINN